MRYNREDQELLRRLRLPKDLMGGGSNITASGWDGPFYQPLWVGFDILHEPGLLSDNVLSAITPQVVWNYTLHGHGRLELEGQEHVLASGHVAALASPSRSKVVKVSEGLPWVMVMISVTGEPAMELADYIVRRFGGFHALPPRCRAVQKATELVRLAQRRPRRSAFFWSRLTYEWLLAWWEDAAASVGTRHGPLEPVPAPSRLASLGSENFKTYAQKVGYSPEHLSRKIKKLWGQSPGAVFRSARLREGARLLTSTSMRVSDVAEQVGYSSAGAFIEAFRREFGKTPLRYRRAER